MVHVLEEVAEARFNEGEGTLILWLFLYPFDGGVGVAGQRRLNVAEWEGSKLLETDDGNIVDAALLSLSLEIVVDLATAEEDLLDLRVGNHLGGGLFDDSLESETDFKVFNVGGSTAEFEKLLGDGDDQRLTELSMRQISPNHGLAQGAGDIQT